MLAMVGIAEDQANGSSSVPLFAGGDMAESFFAILTKELLDDGPFATREEGRRELFEFIEIWYNRQRRHSSLGYRSPAQFETELLKAS